MRIAGEADYRTKYRQRVIRSLRLTPLGLEYIAKKDSTVFPFVMAQQDTNSGSRNITERILRYHAQATALIMARNAGAVFLPGEKPSLLANPLASSAPYDPRKIYYYPVQEFRAAIQEPGHHTDQSVKTVAKSSSSWRHHLRTILPLPILYRHSRMYWLAGTEENMVAALEQVLRLRGIAVEVFSEVIIGTKMSVAQKLMKVETQHSSRYFTISDRYNNIFFITNDHRGDALLGVIADQKKQMEINRQALDGFIPPLDTKFYDAMTPDRRRPVVLGICATCSHSPI